MSPSCFTVLVATVFSLIFRSMRLAISDSDNLKENYSLSKFASPNNNTNVEFMKYLMLVMVTHDRVLNAQ